MKKGFSLLIIGMLVFSGINAVAFSNDSNEIKHISECFSFSNPTMKKSGDYVQVSIDESNAELMNENKPLLPMITKVYTFPLGTKIDEITFAAEESYNHEISKQIMPSPNTDYISTVYPSQGFVDSIDYSLISKYPEKRYSYSMNGGIHNGEHVLFLTLHL